MPITYRSKFEADLAGGPLRGVAYEPVRLVYEVKAKHYTPDFVLPNGVVLEAKGVFTGSDRVKSLAVRARHVGIDLRFVFQTPYKSLSKHSLTTYASWCEKHDFLWCSGKDRETLQAWSREPINYASLAAIGWQEIPT